MQPPADTGALLSPGHQVRALFVESRGGWGLTAVGTWLALAQATAAQSGEAVSVEASRLYEMLAVTLQWENARAVLRRLPEPPPVPGPGAALLHPSRPHLLRWPLLGYVKLCARLPDPYYRSARMQLRGAVHNWACRWRLAVPPKARRHLVQPFSPAPLSAYPLSPSVGTCSWRLRTNAQPQR